MYIDSFIQFLTFEKRYSSHTQVAYAHEVSQFIDYLSAHDLSVTTVTYHQVRSYFSDRMEEGFQPRSVNRSMSALRSFYHFMQREGHVIQSPLLGIKALKVPKKLPVVIDEEKMNLLLDHHAVFSNDFEGLRDKTMLEVLFGTGMRLAELLQLTDQDFDFYAKQVHVLGKRNKQRVIPLADPLVEIVKEYLQAKSNLQMNSSMHSFIVTREGQPAYPKLVYRTVNKYLAMVSSQEKKSPHVLRHTFATALLNNGADLNAIKELLGHANLSATQIYTHHSVKRLKSIYKQAHPRA